MKLDTAPSCLRLCGKNHSVLKQGSSVLGRVMRCGIDLMLLSGVALQNLDSRTGCLFLGQSVGDPKTTRILRQMVRPAAKPSSRWRNPRAPKRDQPEARGKIEPSHVQDRWKNPLRNLVFTFAGKIPQNKKLTGVFFARRESEGFCL